MMKADHDHGSILTMQTDSTDPGFGQPTKTIKEDVAFVRKDGKNLHWRIVQHMAMYIEIEIQKRCAYNLNYKFS
jgi:hypothetical protein